MSSDEREIEVSFEEQAEAFRARFEQLRAEISRAIVGYDELITDTLTAIFSEGHVLLEGVPGLGKTHLIKVISQVLGLTSGRIQCTPDLMPADILGTHIVGEDAEGHRVFRFEKGPVFRHLLLIDEINRATPKTQSALLEVMQEHRVTAGGETFELPSPFFVMATQNPMEMEGTYPLPEAQLDRFFFKIMVPFPDLESLIEISRRTTGAQEISLNPVMEGHDLMACQYFLKLVPVADPITAYAASLILATHPETSRNESRVARYVSYGASPRGLQAMIRAAKVFCLLDGRSAVSVADIQRAAKPALRHRIILNFEGEAESVKVDSLIDEILNQVPAPGMEVAT